MDIDEAIKVLTDAAEKQGADPNDDQGIVRQIVTANGLGFNAWLCVCMELADRSAQREGFRNQVDRAFTLATAKVQKLSQNEPAFAT